jgi:steroid delta-isomerase-like uncharacterized protein
MTDHVDSDPTQGESSAGNRKLTRRYFDEILNRGNFAVAADLLSASLAFRNPPVVAHGIDEFVSAIAGVRAAFPDLHFAIEDEIAEGDKVVTRWRVTGTQRGPFLGHAPAGKVIDVSGINIFRIADGTIQEIWVNMDRLGEAEQLGWLQPSES